MLDMDRFGDIAVHAGAQTLFPVPFHGARRHRNDRDVAARETFPCADDGGSGEAAHFRHLHIHQNHIESPPAHRLQGLPAIDGDFDPMTVLFEQPYSQLLVDGVVFRQQDMQSARRNAKRVRGGGERG